METKFMPSSENKSNALDLMNINVNKPFSLLCVGKSNSGKSHYINFLMREINKINPFDYGVCFSNTSFEGSFNYIPKKYIFSEFDENIIKNLIKLQKNNIEKGINKRCFILMDDCCSDREYNNKLFTKLFVMGRHYNISIILSSQYIYLLTPPIRANCNYMLCFDCGFDKRALESVYNTIGAHFHTYNEFKNFYFANVCDYKFLMFDLEHNIYKLFKCPKNIPIFYIKYNKKIH